MNKQKKLHLKALLLNSIRVTFIALLAIFINSCESEPDLLGLNLQPESEKLGLTFNDTTSIFAYSLIDDSLRSDNYYSPSLLGTFNDPVFGTTSANIFTQIRLSNNNLNFGTNPVLDSVILFLPYKGSYMAGNIYERPYQQTIKIYEINKKMSLDTVYYGDKELAYGNTELGSLTFVPNPNDSVTYNNVKFPPMLMVKLNQAFANKLFSATTADLADNDKFTDFFKGLYIKSMPLSTTQANKGGILYFDLKSSALTNVTIYYKNNEKDSLKYTFLINENAAKYTYFNHYNYSNAHIDLKNQLGVSGTADTNLGFQKLYLQSMGGVKVKLKFPYLLNWIQNQKIVVNEAVLVLKNADLDDRNTPPALLAALKRIADNKTDLLPDFWDPNTNSFTSEFFDARYNAKSREYRIRLTRYFQKMLNTKEDNYGIFLYADSRRTSANRFVFYGSDKNLANRMKLELRYTVIK